MPRTTPERVFTYSVDSADRVESVNADWLAFARENQASHLTVETVVGRPLLRFVAGKETQQLYRIILERVRRTEERVVVPFRCDGPTVRRFMKLDVSPYAEGHVVFNGRLVREERRPAIRILDTATERSDASLVVCSWCKRIVVEGAWLEVEQAVERLGLFERLRLPQLSHGVCPECAITLQRQLAETRRRR